MKLQLPDEKRSPNFRDWAREIEAADRENYKTGRHLTIPPDVYVILTAPDGGRWGLTVNNAGVLGTTAL